MVADPKHELHHVIDQLTDNDAAEMLAFARRLLGAHGTQVHHHAGIPPRPRAVPMLHQAPAIAGIDDLRAALFDPEESIAAFDDAVRRWREEPEGV